MGYCAGLDTCHLSHCLGHGNTWPWPCEVMRPKVLCSLGTPFLCYRPPSGPGRTTKEQRAGSPENSPSSLEGPWSVFWDIQFRASRPSHVETVIVISSGEHIFKYIQGNCARYFVLSDVWGPGYRWWTVNKSCGLGKRKSVGISSFHLVSWVWRQTHSGGTLGGLGF